MALTSKKYNRSYYDEHKADGLDYLGHGEWQESYGRWLVGAFGLVGRSVLDVGCACGSIAEGFRKAGAGVAAVDLNNDMIALGRAQFPGLALAVCDAANLHLLDDDSQDFYHAAQVPEHWRPELVPHILAEAYRVLRPGGRALLVMDTTELFEREGRSHDGDDPTHVCIRPLAWWKDRAAEAGFEADPAGERSLWDAHGSFLYRYNWDWVLIRKPDGRPRVAADPDFPVYLGADRVAVGGPSRRFNGSVIEDGDGYLLAFRAGEDGPGRAGVFSVWLARLRDDFRPTGEAWKLYLGDCPSGQEDPRLFRFRGRIHLSYGEREGTEGDRRFYMKYARLSSCGFRAEAVFRPEAPGPVGHEKNWAFFEHAGRLHAVYSIRPHRVLEFDGERLLADHRTDGPPQWAGGVMRGGASPVMADGRWHHFFHGVRREKTGRRSYHVGCLTFEDRPPFRVLDCTQEPVLSGDPRSDNNQNGADVAVVLGAVRKKLGWAVVAGLAERRLEIRRWSAGNVAKAMTPVPEIVPPEWPAANCLMASAADAEIGLRFLDRLGAPLPECPLKAWDTAVALGALGDGDTLEVGSSGSPVLPGLAHLGRRGRKVGIDLREHALGDGIETVAGDFLTHPLPEAGFDQVVSLSTIEHGVDRAAFAAKVGHVLRPGGRLVVSFDYCDPPLSGADGWQPLGRDAADDLVTRLAEAGLAPSSPIDWTQTGRPVGPPWSPTGEAYTFAVLVFDKVRQGWHNPSTDSKMSM